MLLLRCGKDALRPHVGKLFWACKKDPYPTPLSEGEEKCSWYWARKYAARFTKRPKGREGRKWAPMAADLPRTFVGVRPSAKEKAFGVEGALLWESVEKAEEEDFLLKLERIVFGEEEGGSAQSGSAQDGAAQGGSAEDGSAQGGAAQSGRAQGGTAQSGSAHGGSAQGGSAHGGSSQGGGVQGGGGGGEVQRSHVPRFGMKVPLVTGMP